MMDSPLAVAKSGSAQAGPSGSPGHSTAPGNRPRHLAVLAVIGAGSYGDEARVDPDGQSPIFEITASPIVHKKPITARVYVMLGSDGSSAEPRLGPDWFRPQPFFAMEIQDWQPGNPLRIDSRAVGFPAPLGEIEPGRTRSRRSFVSTGIPIGSAMAMGMPTGRSFTPTSTPGRGGRSR